MKNIFLLAISILVIWSCSNSNKKDPNTVGKSIVIIPLDQQIDTSTILINASFPFGNEALSMINLPKHWPADLENYGQLKKPEGKEFEKNGAYYQAINAVNTIKSPFVENIENIDLGPKNATDYYLDTLSNKSIDSCKYRLPNFGKYESYYYVEPAKRNANDVYGNLLLLDPKTQNGKVLNIYFEYGGDQSINMRYFFIQQNTINIYEGSCYDDGCGLAETFRISIDNEGEIKISPNL